MSLATVRRQQPWKCEEHMTGFFEALRTAGVPECVLARDLYSVLKAHADCDPKGIDEQIAGFSDSIDPFWGLHILKIPA